MCGRYIADPEDEEHFFEHFAIDFNGELKKALSREIRPTNDVLVVRANEKGREGVIMQWGFMRSFDKKKAPKPLFNCRGEEAAVKRTWSKALRERRCIIPATGFYEWSGEKGKKQKWRIGMKSGEPMGFAGLWEDHADNGLCCTIVTCAPNELIGKIHNRMPVIVKPKDYEIWLDRTADEEDALERAAALIEPYEADAMMAAKAVS
ncbi:MAG: SOS response-associated peptidase [Planctomycetes bacterium]|nr:SOS response-associated peptidase [Planctomycetota bacterium]NUQ35280.1 SOS response-associated peptidase [Planctomycetaceae bacterium]